MTTQELRRPTDHHLRPLSGRDPQERFRSSTPLELLYDLVFVVAFGTAAEQAAHYLAQGRVGTEVAGFATAVTAIVVAWGDYSWFTSAYDNDDWVFRVATMVQMVGVVVVSLGIQDMFVSVAAGGAVDVRVMALGYIVMRLSMVSLWWRVARGDSPQAAAARAHILSIGIAQIGWTVLAFAGLPLLTFVLTGSGFLLLDVVGPWVAEHKKPTPWHARHIAERYGLLILVTLGEGVFGTVAALNALVHADHGWTADAVLLAVAGIGLTFGMWWMYFAAPWGEVLERHRERSAIWSVNHILLLSSTSATGAGLHAAASLSQGRSTLGRTGTVTAVAIPIAVFVGAVYTFGWVFLRKTDPVHALLLTATAAVLVLAVLLAAAGVGIAWCLVVLTAAPVISVIGHETIGSRHVSDALSR
ncbi:low temperature requirement protein A [Catenulispora subtropica]|uniref:Low temperature requirement protein A n=1 Tax=Catenulispora subtropica TaxID=450798 RepID=A0ABP5DHY1_9ACTN